MRRALPLLLLLSVTLSACKSGTAGRVVSVTVQPNAANVVLGTTLQLHATVIESFDQVVYWSVVGGAANGTVSATGLYTPPATVPTPPQVTVLATSQRDRTKSAPAILTISAQPLTITILVSPGTPSIPSFGTQQFSAMVSGSTNTAVTWQVQGVTGGSRATGFISTSGFYVAPGGPRVTSDGLGGATTTTLTVTALSQADNISFGSATVTIVPGNQSRQAGPVSLGTSGGNALDSIVTGGNLFCCGGTLGSLVSRNGSQFILSNTHVVARSDAALLGESILQPGLIDTNCDKTRGTPVATLSQFANLETESKSASAANVDAAIAQVLPGAVDPSGNILYLGATADANNVPQPGAPHVGVGLPPTVGMAVAKSGRTTGLTCSSVMTTNIAVSVDYTKNCDGSGASFTVTYDNQVQMGSDFSAHGDSGSLIVTQSTADPVALLYAGSDTDTLANPVAPVLSFFASGGHALSFVGGAAHPVIGCTLPTAPQSGSKTTQAATLTADVLQNAITARDAHAPELLAFPQVQALGVGSSYDNPAEPAIVFFVIKGLPHSNLPAQVDGVRTRIVEADLFPRRGSLSADDTALNEQSAAPPQLVYSISDAEFTRAKLVHAAHSAALMQQPAIQGVGITSSVDSPGEAALMIFLVRGAAHNPIPPLIDGLRTRLRESSHFRAGLGTAPLSRACSLPSTKPNQDRQSQPHS